MEIISGFIIEFTKSQKEDVPFIINSFKEIVHTIITPNLGVDSGGGSEGWRARIMTDW